MRFIGRNKDNTFHISDGQIRTYTAAPESVIDAFVKAGQPLIGWRTNRQVRTLADVPTVNVKEMGITIDKFGARTFKAA